MNKYLWTGTVAGVLSVAVLWPQPAVIGAQPAAIQAQAVASEQALSPLVARLVAAAEAGRPAPVLSADHALTIEQAYQLQTAAVKRRLRSAQPAGFKAGLTSLSARKKFAVEQAVAGVLLPAGNRPAHKGRFTLRVDDFNTMMLEAEIGFLINTAITERVTDIETLKTKVAAVLPVAEFPDLSFDRPEGPQGVDIIANNVLAKQFIAGEQRALQSLTALNRHGRPLAINDLTIRLYRDDALILEGQSRDAMGDQWRALQWLVNRTIDNGWSINRGQLLITGALGKMLAARPGRYRIDYGALGQIEFQVAQSAAAKRPAAR